MADISMFFTEEEKADLMSTLLNVTYRTTGEIRVRVEKKAGRNPLAAAKQAFLRLGMRENRDKNGVLFYISVFDKKFAVVGDDGINEKVSQDFWETVKKAVVEKFSSRQFAIGLNGGIGIVAEKLAQFFPDEKIDLKENPDAVTFEE
jgi:uncharacterized membrane protein